MLINEAEYASSLGDFSRDQKQQIARWLACDNNINCDPGVIESARRVVTRSTQQGTFDFAEIAIRGLLDAGTGLDGSRSLEERLAITLMGPSVTCDLLDWCFTVYGDGSLMVGYEHTGFMIDCETATVIHPASRFSFQLAEKHYDLSFGQKVGITGRTLFFYHLAKACAEIVQADAALAASPVVIAGEVKP